MRNKQEIQSEINRLEPEIDKYNNKGDFDMVRTLSARKWALKWVLEEEE